MLEASVPDHGSAQKCAQSSRIESKRIGSDAHPGSPLLIHLPSDLQELLFRGRLDDRIELQACPVVLLDRILCSDLGSSRLTYRIHG